MIYMLDPLELDQCVAVSFLAWRELVGVSDSLLEREGLGRAHHRVLFMVARSPGLGVSELASVLRISRQALSRSLRELSERGLVTQAASEADARVMQVWLSAKGVRLERRLTGLQARALEQAFAEVGESAAEGWMAVMRRLAASALARPEAEKVAEYLKPPT